MRPAAVVSVGSLLHHVLGRCVCCVVGRALSAGIGLRPCAAPWVPQGDLLLSFPGPASLQEDLPDQGHVRKKTSMRAVYVP
jgi:hypothetical protein